MAVLPVVCSANVSAGIDLIEVTGTDANSGLPVALSALNCRPPASVFLNGVAFSVKEVVDTTHVRLSRAWSGASGAVACEISPFTPEMASRVELSKQLRDYDAKLELFQARGFGLAYKAIGPTGLADPGPGNVAYVGASWAAATAICIDVVDKAGTDQTPIIDQWGLGDIIVFSSVETDGYVEIKLTEQPVNEGPGAWRKLVEFAYIGGDGTVVLGEDLRISWQPSGPPGAGFVTDATVADPAGRAAHDAEAVGFTVFIQDVGGAEAGRAAVDQRVGAPGGWVRVAWYTGPKGSQGDKGWAPQLVTVADGERRVLMLAGYVGGEGTAPTANVGDYLKADGTFTANIAEAADMRGPAGVSFIWRGPYSGVAAYAENDLAGDQGAAWIALQATTGHAPPTRPTAANAYWELMVDKGADGLGTGDVVGPASATDGAIVLFDGVGGKLIKNGAVTIIDEDDMSSDSASAVPTQQSTKAYVDAAVAGIDLTQIEEHDLVISQILLKLADIENSAEFMGPAGNWVADSFDALTYVDTVNASNLDTSQAGVLKPAIAAGTSTMSVTLPSTTAQPLITFRNVFAAAAISTSGAFVRAKFQGPATGSNPKNWANSFIGHAAASGDAYDFDGNQVRLTFGGANGVTPPVGGSIWSDWVPLAVDETKALVVAIEGATSQDTKAAASLGANYNAYYKEALDASTINATGYTLVSGNVIAISDIEVKSSIAPANATVPLGAFPASVAPTKMKALLLVEETDAATAGTDYQLRVSRNNKTNWTSATLTERGSAGAGMIWVETDTVDVSGQPTGTQIWGEWKTLNNKNVKLHGWKLYWGN